MFVSFLQLFGITPARQAEQPLKSRAEQNTRPDTQSGDGGGTHPEAASQRRQAVKAKPAKSAKANQAARKPVAAAKKAAKPAKAASKSVAKVPVKTTAKPKSDPKTVGKPAVNSKSAVKKSAPKPVAKAPPVKVKVLAKAAKAATKSVAKTAATPAQKASVKVVGKPIAKLSTKPVPKASAKPVKSKPVPVTASKKAVPVAVPPAAATPVVPFKPAAVNNGLPPPPPLKPGRRSSSRALAHMPPPAPMVPTHAPDAAKASYSTMTERVIAPPPHVAAKKDPKLANNWKIKAVETLTDDEVKAMPDSEYMNDKQMAFFRFKLSILKQDIHNSAGATTEHLREDTAVVPDPADRATIEEEHALELRTRDRERKLLKKIEQSIARIDSGDYGYCDETGEPIGVGRLIARPTASLSLEAQQRRELKQKMFGD